MVRVLRSVPVLCALVLAACGSAAPAPAPAAPMGVPALPMAAVTSASERELTFDVAELI
ncbi:MAG: hypothetical protein ACYC9W_07315 [Candidatus Limnocylindria bacterium]